MQLCKIEIDGQSNSTKDAKANGLKLGAWPQELGGRVSDEDLTKFREEVDSQFKQIPSRTNWAYIFIPTMVIMSISLGIGVIIHLTDECTQDGSEVCRGGQCQCEKEGGVLPIILGAVGMIIPLFIGCGTGCRMSSRRHSKKEKAFIGVRAACESMSKQVQGLRWSLAVEPQFNKDGEVVPEEEINVNKVYFIAVFDEDDEVARKAGSGADGIAIDAIDVVALAA